MRVQKETLSEYLLAKADEFISYPIRLPKDPDRREEWRKRRHNLAVVGRKLLAAREWFEQDPQTLYPETPNVKQEAGLRRWLNEEYTLIFLQEVPKLVKRTMRMAQLRHRRLPSQAVNLYLREATRSYVRGLWTASVALSRAALESALREELRVTGRLGLGALLSAAKAQGVLDTPEFDLASRVKEAGDRALHGETGTDSDARVALDAVRAVLEKLYDRRVA